MTAPLDSSAFRSSPKLRKLYAERRKAAAAGNLKKLELISIKVETELERLEFVRYKETQK